MSVYPNWYNWWLEIRKDIKNWVNGNAPGVISTGDNLLTRDDFDLQYSGLDRTYTYSGSYVNSSIYKKYGDNLKFYLAGGSTADLITDISRVSVVKRTYYYGAIGIVFYDNASGKVIVPANLDFSSSITLSSRQNGEFLIRQTGGSVTDPLYTSTNIDEAANVFVSSTAFTPNSTPITPEPEPIQKFENSSSLPGLELRHMVGGSSVPYVGQVIITQVKKNGYWILTITGTGGESLGIGNPQFSNLWSGSDQGYKVPDSEITSTDVDAFGWLTANYGHSLTPDPVAPPDMDNHSVNYNSSNIKYWFKTAVGNRYYVGPITIEYNFSGGNYYWTKFKTADGQYLTLINPTNGGLLSAQGWNGSTPYYKIIYNPGNTYLEDLEKQMGGTVEPPPNPITPPPPDEKKLTITDPLNSKWSFLRLVNLDGTPYTGAYIIEYKQGRNDGTASNIQIYYMDSTGKKINLQANFGEVNGINENAVYDDSGNVIGKTYDIVTGSQGLEAWLGENYQNNNNYPAAIPIKPQPRPPPEPTPEPTPPAPTESLTDEPLSRINVNDHPGLIFRESISGERIENDDIEIFSLGDLDSDGKTEVYFRTPDGRELTIEQAEGYHYKDYPEDDTKPTGARRLAEGRTLYQMSGTNETIANAFSSGFGASKNIDLEEKSLLERLPIKGFVVYNKSNKKHFTIKNKDSLLNGLQIIGIMKHNIGKKSQFIPLTAEHNELGQKKMIDEGTTGAGEITGSGGERPREEFDLMSAPDLCGGGGSGRRLRECAPGEPAPKFNEFKHEVSESELLNFERNREIMEKEKDPQYLSLTLYERLRDTTSEEELISMYATFSGVAYLEQDKRPDIFGLDYLKDESSNNLAVYKGRANKNIVISYRGTKPTNGIDLLSDALILTGYEKQASLRFENALREAERLLDKYPGSNILLTGHSLGGALAEFVIDELKANDKYRNRNIKSIVFNPGKSPNTKTERADKIAETLNEVSLVKAIKTGNPEYLPILNNIQSRLGISVNDITNPEIMTSRDELQSILSNYPELSRSFNGLSSRMSATQTLAEREALAVEWIEANRALLPQTIDYIGSLGNLIKTKLYFDMILKVFDFSTNYTIDQVLKEESDLDKRISKSKKPYDELFKDSDNVIFRYSRDPISLQHSFLENDKKNVRTYHEGNTSLLFDGLGGTMGEGLKQHGIDNFILKKHKGYLKKDESWLEYFSNIFNDNVESTGEILTGLKYKLNDLEKQYIQDNGWLSFLGL